MISRRNIRIKVMQVLYTMKAMNGGEEVKSDPVAILRKNIDQTGALFIYLIYFITEVARYAEINARNRASRNIVTEDDLHVNIKIAGNQLLWNILESENFKSAVKLAKPELLIDRDLIKKIYTELTQSELYKKYTAELHRDKLSEKDILLYIFTDFMLPSENFISHLEENFSNWDDDAELMELLVPAFLHKPSAYNLLEIADSEKWKFGRELLLTTIEKETYLTTLIEPKLKNWDKERIAMLDMILMQMGVSEFLYFETIPPKVTINEYIDIAKEYSTAQSGQFVNGILDGIHKELVEKNTLHKTDFKQKA